MYELFHAAHIVLAIITIVGCWYHIIASIPTLPKLALIRSLTDLI